MQRTLTNRRRAVVLSLALIATGFVGVQNGQAQDPAPNAGNRMRILVPTLEFKGATRTDFGKKTAEQVSKLIATLPTHIPVAATELKESLKKYGLKEDQLDCIKNRQLAVQMNSELVMCGLVEPNAGGFQVSAQFISAKTGETFEIEQFQAATPDQAAQNIFKKFGDYVKQLSLAAFCSDYLGSQQWDKALDTCGQALTINPNSQVALMGRAMALYRSGMATDQSAVTDTAKLQEAMLSYKKVIEINPINQDALRQAGIIAARIGHAEESRNYFRQYMELNPGDVSVRLAIASEAQKNGDAEGALRIIEAGLQADSASTDLLTYAGHTAIAVAAKATDKAKSAQFYETAARYYGKVFAAKDTATDVSVLQNLILANVQLDRKQEAVNIGAKAVAAKPKDPAVWAVYAQALQSADKPAEALAALDTLAKLDPNNPRLTLQRARALLAAKRLDDAKQAFQTAIAAGTDADEAAQAIFVVGFERYRANDWDAALDYFGASRDIAKSEKSRGQANFWSGMIYYQRGIALAKTQTAKVAKSALPLFQHALDYFQSGGVNAYADATPGVKLGQTVSAVRQYIDIENQIIKRGK